MSFEQDITAVLESIDLNEGYSQAKATYVDSKPPQMSLRQLNTLAAKDPTKNKKYIEWMARTWVSGERSTRRYDIIKEFDELCNKNKIQQKDINQYRNLEAVHDTISDTLREMSRAEEQQKEQATRQALIDMEGSTGRAYKYLNGRRLIRNEAGEVTGVNEDIPEYVTEEFVEEIRQKMLKEKSGIFGKDFTIDTKLFDLIDPADVVPNKSQDVIILKPTTLEKSQLYGRYPPNWPEAKGRDTLGSPWCTSYTRGTNRFGQYYQAGGDTFYIILPKSVDIVPEKKYTKINVQAAAVQPGAKQHLTAWNFDDDPIPTAEIKRIFKAWHIKVDPKIVEIGE